MLYSLLFAFCIILWFSASFPARAETADTSINAVVNQLNTIRQEARMTPLTHSPLLTKAAQNHANYLSHHVSSLAKKGVSDIDLHAQHSSHSGFTGEHASERAQRVGYPTKMVKENISSGNKNSGDSIDGLMSGIYHRFTFLDFLIDTVGYGVATDRSDSKASSGSSGYSAYVYNMGRKDLEKDCTHHPERAKPKQAFDCLGKTVNADYMEKLCTTIPSEALYEDPHPLRCPNGALLRASYMDDTCRTRPDEIRFSGRGSYFNICKPALKVSTTWFENICRSNDPSIIHSGETHYYKICNNKKRVYTSWLKERCQSASLADQNMDSSSYSKVCNSNFKVNSEHLERLNQQYYKRNADYVIWPPVGARQVTPVFFEEDPDPLPDLSVSGYPLSLHFNPGKVTSVKLSNFRLVKIVNSKTSLSIQNIREINHKTDPQNIFSKLHYAWFPLQRLEWNTYYRASVTATLDGRTQKINWGFKTRSVNTPLLTVGSNQKEINVPMNQWFALYAAPNSQVKLPFKRIKFKWSGASTSIESDIVDSNTLKVRIDNVDCQVVDLELAQGKNLKLNTCGGG